MSQQNLIDQNIERVTPSLVPLFIHIDPTNLCNFKCTFCPTGDHALLKSISRPRGFMSIRTFEKIINDLDHMVLKYKIKPKEIDLFKDGEPLLNKNLEKMIAILSQKNFTQSLGLTTNASALTPKRSRQLIESGLQKIKFSIEHVTDDGYEKVTKTRFPFERIHNNIRTFWNINLELGSPVTIHSKIVNVDYDQSVISKFREIFAPISHSISIDDIHGWSASNTRDWKLGVNPEDADGSEISGKVDVCHQPFNLLTILFNGDLTPCCVDWSHRLVIGNIHKNSLDELWNGAAITEQRAAQINQTIPRESPCFKCSYKTLSSLSRGRRDKIDELALKQG